MNRPLRVLILGDTRHRDFFPAVQALHNDELVQVVDNDLQPIELVLWFQARPSTGDAKRLETLKVNHPLTGFAVILGTWCEGETRTGQPILGYDRLFWYQFPAWWQAVRTKWNLDEPGHWQHLAGPPQFSELPLDGQVVVVDSEDYHAAAAVIDAIANLGGQGIWQPRWQPIRSAPAVAAGVWIGAQLDSAETEQFKGFAIQLPRDLPLAVLLDFPRRECVEIAKQLGATQVLGKPWRLEQLAVSIATMSSTAISNRSATASTT